MDRVGYMLQQLLTAALKDEALCSSLLASRREADPMAAFCRVAAQAGYPITVGELFAVGQEYNDEMLRSTNGGNPHPMDGWDDAYENFMVSLEEFSL